MWGYANPKVNKEGKNDEAKTKTSNCPRSFFRLNISGRCLFFRKVPLYTKVLRKVVNSYKNKTISKASKSGGRVAVFDSAASPTAVAVAAAVAVRAGAVAGVAGGRRRQVRLAAVARI